jgi:hypothetical protein
MERNILASLLAQEAFPKSLPNGWGFVEFFKQLELGSGLSRALGTKGESQRFRISLNSYNPNFLSRVGGQA